MDKHARSRWWKAMSLLLGGGMLIGAVIYAWNQADWTGLKNVHLGMLAGLVCLVWANFEMTVLLFEHVTNRFHVTPKVSWTVMRRLITASALWNYLPVGWAGPVGRSAYLKINHGLPIRESMLILGIVLLLGVGMMLGAIPLMAWEGQPMIGAGALGIWLILLGVVTQVTARKYVPKPDGWCWTWPVMKAMDWMVNAWRLWLVFDLMGHRITYSQAILLSSVDMLVTMVSLTPSGLGLSEWVIGAMSQTLNIASGPTGIAAKLLDRSANILVTVPWGVWSSWQLRAKR